MARVGHEGTVYSVAFSPDGKYVVTTCSDEPARVLYWRPVDLVMLASSRLTRNLTYQEWQLYFADEPYRRTCENLPVHPTFIERGRDLARAGDIEGAVAIFRRTAELHPSVKLNPQAEAKKYAAEALLEKGRELGEAGDIESSKARFQEARELDSNLKLDPEQEAHRYAAEGLVKEGRALVALRDIDGATAKFQKALELHPRLTLDVQAEISRYLDTGSDVNDVNLTITADNIATRRETSKKTWDWTVFIQGPEHLLDQVDYVEYTLHPSFRSPPQIVKHRGTGPYAFSLSASGWGTFNIKIRVFLKNGHVQHLSHFLRFVDSQQ